MPNFHDVFGNIAVFGMIHLSGNDIFGRALEELCLYADEGLDGAIIENYHCRNLKILEEVLKAAQGFIFDGMLLGVNILPNDYERAMELASTYGARFVQIDYISGNYEHSPQIDPDHYLETKAQFPELVVLGGVHPKYYTPVEGSNLRQDLAEGIQRTEAVVVTGEGTGISTPLEKIVQFRDMIESHPLIVGAGLTHRNAYNQLLHANGCIVGSCFKPNKDTSATLNSTRIR